MFCPAAEEGRGRARCSAELGTTDYVLQEKLVRDLREPFWHNLHWSKVHSLSLVTFCLDHVMTKSSWWMQRDRRGQSVTIGGNRKVGAVVLGQYNGTRWIKEGQMRGKDELQENLGYFQLNPHVGLSTRGCSMTVGLWQPWIRAKASESEHTTVQCVASKTAWTTATKPQKLWKPARLHSSCTPCKNCVIVLPYSAISTKTVVQIGIVHMIW